MPTTIQTIVSLDQHIAWYSNCTLTGINLKRKEDGWLVILKVKDRKGKAMVTFVHGQNLEDAFDWITVCLTTTAHSLKWKEDVYSS